jgi:hypothetical protein
MIFLIVDVLALVLLVMMWLVSDAELRTRVILTVLWVAIWGVFFLNPYIARAIEALLALCMYWVTFGPDLGRRR